ncbi:MAG: 16S rRNA (uracil(1498)-N(3))-methyltransferase, partial [Gammaproteobacteria bacterium]
PLILFNGEGGEFAATVTDIDKRTVTVAVGDFQPTEREPPLQLHLAQGISRGERMDYTIQKAVELGVSRIIPLFTEHCGVRLDGERLARRVRHWQGVVIGACEQCGRNHIPRIDSPVTLAQWLMTPAEGLRVVLAPDAQRTLAQFPVPTDPVMLLIGPEGGLSDQEISQAQAAGYLGLRLGPRILRTETAAVAALAAMLGIWGDFR